MEKACDKRKSVVQKTTREMTREKTNKGKQQINKTVQEIEIKFLRILKYIHTSFTLGELKDRGISIEHSF